MYFSETINGLGATYWKSFSREQYFDSDGLFISTIFSIPILLNCMLMIVRERWQCHISPRFQYFFFIFSVSFQSNWLYSSTVLMSKVKAAQLREERKKMSIRMSMYNPEGNQSTEERQKRMSLLNSQWNSMYGPEATQLREERKSRMTMLKNRLNNPEAADPSTEPSTEPTEEPNTEPSVKLPRRKSLSKSPSKSKHKSEWKS